MNRETPKTVDRMIMRTVYRETFTTDDRETLKTVDTGQTIIRRQGERNLIL